MRRTTFRNRVNNRVSAFKVMGGRNDEDDDSEDGDWAQEREEHKIAEEKRDKLMTRSTRMLVSP